MAAPRSTLARALRLPAPHKAPRILSHSRRLFHSSPSFAVVKPFPLADIGEGITECQLIQWFVQPGARVEQFDKICEVQSDKASVEITSPFDGVIQKLHYEPDDMAITGKPLVDIDIQGGEEDSTGSDAVVGQPAAEAEVKAEGAPEPGVEGESSKGEAAEQDERRAAARPSKNMASLATPAVRHLTKELNVDLADVQGSGRDGRVLKEDVHRHVSQSSEQSQQPQSPTPAPTAAAATREDRKAPLTPVQNQMFKMMTRALNIPHFLYTCEADMTAITTLRKQLNTKASDSNPKLTHLPFIIKAVSLALTNHPLLNSSLDTSDPKKPSLTYRGAHNIGVAIDAPSGLLVPVLKNVQDLTIPEIASTLRTLADKARDNKLAPGDFSGATFTLSNIGSVGGGVVAPVISEPQVGILGVGRSKVVPAFGENGELVRREELVLSWSADHRVVDGAECARCAERVKGYLEAPGAMLMGMK